MALTSSNHPPRPILAVAEEIIEQIRKDDRMDAALDAYAPGHENVHVRWLSKLRGYEITLRFGAAVLDGDGLQAVTPKSLSAARQETP